ncbi:cupin domain-containing protein [Beauveria bassiana ARSEF 2860]|uniref:Cupin domain-containing protein n=1 Tax=Beauveria bassiana (strain ARSEF 2860) TaxID=655819 RepID=J4KRG7_BEAB2|nr:cupin domain-containing protein [Beauveria bassiana ARSEF 2860]EJP70924.1 cupin domain-containing protein [Beauveria bassiana ARSEF 2860]
MASLIPFISEILPMIMPASTHVTAAKDLRPAHPTVEGPVIRRAAVVDRCDKMCASVLTTRPRSRTPVRHNSEQGWAELTRRFLDAIIYAVSGTGVLLVNESFEEEIRRHPLGAGDFAFVPAWTEHQIHNDTDDDLVMVVIQSGSRPVGAILSDWGGDEVTADITSD